MSIEFSHIPDKNQTTFNNDFLDKWLPLLTKSELRVYIALKRHGNLKFASIIKFTNLSPASANSAMQTLVFKELVAQNEGKYSIINEVKVI